MAIPIKSAGIKRAALENRSLNIDAPLSKKRKAPQSLTPIEALMEGVKARNYLQVCHAATCFHWSFSFDNVPQIHQAVVQYYECRIFQYLDSVLEDKKQLFLYAIKYNEMIVALDLIRNYPSLIQTIYELIYYNEFDFVKKFVDENTNAVLDDQYKLLQCSGYYGSVDILHYLLAQLPVEDYQNDLIANAFFCTLTEGLKNREGCVETFERVLGSEIVKGFNFNGKSPLYVAAELGLTDIVKNLLKSGHNVNEVAESDYSPLDIALIKENIPVAQLLLEKGARVDIGGGLEAIFAFNRAIKVKNLHMIDLIYKQYGQAALVSDEEGNTATHFAVYEGFMDGLLYLKSEGLFDMTSDEEGFTPIDTILVSDLDRPEWERILGKLIQWEEDFLLSTPLPENIYGESNKSTYMHRIVEKGYKTLTAGLLLRQKKERPLLEFMQERERGMKHGKPRRENLTELRDGNGNSIMHTAGRRGDNLMMQVLCNIAPELLKTENNDGKTPKDLFLETLNKSGPS